MRRISLLSFLPIFFLGCAGADSDGDGLTNGEEEELGTNPDKKDSDGDGLDDGEELDLETDPTVEDTDEDGINDGEEVDMDLDPVAFDTDFDGLGDGDEIEAESDPLNRYSWPDGNWPDMRGLAEEAGLDTTLLSEVDDLELEMGEVFPNFTAPDVDGNEVELYQFYSSVILIDFSAGWCGPCNQVASTAQDFWTEYREDGFVIIHAMTDDWQAVQNSPFATQEFLAEWIEEYELTFPVLGNEVEEGDSEIDMAYAELYYAGLNEGYIPYMILLNQDMELEEIYTGSGLEAQIQVKVEELLEEAQENEGEDEQD